MKEINLSKIGFTEDLLNLLTPELAKKFCAIPISLSILPWQTEIKIAVIDPNDIEIIDSISTILLTSYPNAIIDYVSADKKELMKYIEKFYIIPSNDYDAMLAEFSEDDRFINYRKKY